MKLFKFFKPLAATAVAVLFCAAGLSAAEFRSAWPAQVERVWPGRAYWSNPLQDWRISQGRLECVVSGKNRNVHLLTHSLSGQPEAFEMRVRLGLIQKTTDDGWAGFRFGVQGELDDYRHAIFRGRGVNAGITTSGRLFIGSMLGSADRGGLPITDVELRLRGEPEGAVYDVTLSAHDPATGERLAEVQGEVRARKTAGGLALVNDWTPEGEASSQDIYGQDGMRGGSVRFWFRDWRASGPKLAGHPDRAFGPILFSQYTLSRGVMKMTAQMPPLGRGDNHTVRLQIFHPQRERWETVDEEEIHTLARTAAFRVPQWDSTRDTPYRLAYTLVEAGGETEHYWTGTVRRDPADKEQIVVAGFTGNKDTGFPNTKTVENVRYHDPDVMVFTGDQIYEDVAGYGFERGPVETAALDYLRKWYLLGWSFGGLMRDRVTVSMPDDHDVYQGNIWGGGGREMPLEEHERGGYAMQPEWVNMVQRTQTSHLPDPYDPRPVAQGIGVYYTELNYGGISFAILEDRKFKSGPKGLVPPTGGRPDHVTDPNFDPKDYDVPGAKLLGERQLKFIRDWASDWRGADMKVSLSQTIFANAATTHGPEMMRLEADLDSNGWPQSARNRALRALRKGFAFMLGGDQHLPTILHHGVEEFNDAGYSFSVPSIAAGYPRAYEPEEPAVNRPPGAPEYAGERFDGLGNRMTVYAVANPKKDQRESPLDKLHDKASGYGILRLNKPAGTIRIECWPLLADASQPDAEQFPGWPKTIHMTDNYGREAEAYLPEVKVEGLENPVVQVIEEGFGEVVYTLRVRGQRFRPKVFCADSAYTVRVGEPGTRRMKKLEGLAPLAKGESKTVVVRF